MSFIAIRSLPLGSKSKEAWREAGAVYLKRGSSEERILNIAERVEAEFILNLGRTSFRPMMELTNIPIWNFGTDIYSLLWPGHTREILGDLMPLRPTIFPALVWVKAPGYGGRGKYMEEIASPLVLPHQWDWQEHVEGQEWRLITVGQRVVQDMKRFGENGERTYEWVPMADTPSAIKDLAREAASRMEGNNVIAWDMILTNGGRALLFEGNTCPGVNTATAARIHTEITRQQEERMNA